MNWREVAKSLKRAAADRRNMAQFAADRNRYAEATAMEESAHVLDELAYALTIGIERDASDRT